MSNQRRLSLNKALELPEAREPRFRLIGAHEFGLVMVVIGLLSLFVATFEYCANIRTLGPEYPIRGHPLSLMVAGLVALLGVLALITVAMRM